jgi:PTS system nitrogen regulatory IIA component
LENLDHVAGALILLESPVEFEAIDKQPVDVVFSLFAPKSAGVEHLKALALVSRTLREQSTVAKLRSNPDPTTIYTILTEPANVQAA